MLPPSESNSRLVEAIAIVRKHGKCSTSFLQRSLSIGYGDAEEIVEQMEALGIVSVADNFGKRQVLPESPQDAMEHLDELAPTDAQEAEDAKRAKRDAAYDKLGQPHDVQGIGHNMVSGEELRAFFERIERVRSDKQKQADIEKEIFAELKSRGYDKTVVRNILKLRTLSPSVRDEGLAITELYMAAIGMLSEPPLIRHMAGLGVDPAIKEQVIGALKMITPVDGEIILRSGGTELHFIRTPDGVNVSEVHPNQRVQATGDGADDAPMTEPEADAFEGVDSAGAKAMGVDARKADLPIVQNPFPFGDQRRRAWDEGWREEDGGHGFGSL